MERAIGKYSTSIKSKVSCAANANNIIESFAMRSYLKSAMDINTMVNPIVPKPYSSNTFRNHPSDSETSQLWEPFLCQTLNQPLDSTIENIPIKSIIKSLKKHYSRSNSIPFHQTRINNFEITIAGRAWMNDEIYSSVFDRRKKKESRRGNHLVMFESCYIE